MKIRTLAAAAAVILAATECAWAEEPTVTVSNPLGFDRTEVVGIPMSVARAKARQAMIDAWRREGRREGRKGWGRVHVADFVAIDSAGGVHPTQQTFSGQLIFQASVPACGTATYTIAPAPEGYAPDTLACGKIYPYRQDDLAWENDLVGFRAYGPGTTRRGEKMYGYDLFLKRGTSAPVLESLYLAQNDPENWKIVNGLHAQGLHAQADSVQNSFTYHVDHGYGMDCYAVGATLGAGATAPIGPDGHLAFPGCFTEQGGILDNGPLRFTATMAFAPQVVGGDTLVEVRTITLDAGSHFVHTQVGYDGATAPLRVAAGVALHDQTPPRVTPAAISYLDPTQGPDNGEVYVGIIMAQPGQEAAVIDGNAVIITELQPLQGLEYYWGYGWNRADVPSLEAWSQIMERQRQAMAAPLTVEY